MKPHPAKKFLPLILAIFLVGCATEEWVMQKNGQAVSEAELNMDKLRCEREAAVTYPYAPASVSIPNGYSSGSSTTCVPVGKTIRCDTSGGATPAPQVFSYDGNSSRRTEFQERCMSALGYKSISINRGNTKSPDSAAINNLGIKYAKGDGVPKDSSKAFDLFNKSALMGNAEAQTNLGIMYEKGVGIPRNADMAVEWYMRAANQGLARAQNLLGYLYLRRYGNQAKALEWFQQAADRGDANAHANIGSMYRDGEGVPKDSSIAIEWYLKAAEFGYAHALNLIGEIYDYGGGGISKNPAKAIEWYEKAAAKGDPVAKSHLNKLRPNLN